jgi:predicted DNA-binding transcriptional regulator AlpA
MTKKNRKRITGQHPGVVKQGEALTHPPEKVQPATKVPASTVEPLLLSIADVCALLNVSRSTLLRLEKVSGLPGRVKLGGQIRYHRGIIEKWLLEQIKS